MKYGHVVDIAVVLILADGGMGFFVVRHLKRK